jgi:hypothetical protein
MTTSSTPSSSANATVRDAAETYYRHLLSTGHHASTAAVVREVAGSGSAVYQGAAFCASLMPCFISKETESLAYAAARNVGDAIRVLARQIAADRALWDGLHLNDAQRRALEYSFCEPVSLLNRFDGFALSDGDIRFMECNPTPPGGMVYADMLTRAFEVAPIMREFRERFPVRTFSQDAQLFDAVLSTFERLGGRGKPRIALATDASPKGFDRADGTARSTIDVRLNASVEMQFTLRSLQRSGIEVFVAAPYRFEFVDGKLSLDGGVVDAVIVASWTPLLAVGPSHPIFRAAREGRVWLVNSPVENIFLGNKNVLAMLSDRAVTREILTPELAEAVERHVPWTRALRPGVTTYQGRRVELADTVMGEREDFVLKPADSWGGQGLRFGSDHDDAEWRALVAQSMQGDYIVQERLRPPQYRYPVEGADAPEERTGYVDLNPFVWGGDRPYGFIARVSPSVVTNVAKGATMVPVFVLE